MKVAKQIIQSRLTLPLILVVGFIVRWIDIAKSSIWHDEGYTMMISVQSVSQIIARTGRDVLPPLYYIALHFWLIVFGNTPATARGMSLAFGLVCMVGVFYLADYLFNRRVAVVSAWLAALGPFLVRYSQEARMYTMTAALLTWGTYCFVRALEKNEWRWWIGYALLMTAGLYTHYYTIFVLLIHAGYAAIKTDWRGKKHGLFSGKLWVAVLAIGAAFVPWLPVAYGQFTRVQAAYWIGPVTVKTIPGTLYQFLLYRAFGPAPSWFHLLSLAVLVAVGSWLIIKTTKSDRLKVGLITVYAFLPSMLVFGLSLKRPIYQDRYFVFAAAVFTIWLALIVLKTRWAKVLVAVLTVTSLYGIHQVYAAANHQMGPVAKQFDQQYQPGDDIICGELYVYFDFSYYNTTGVTPKLLNKGRLDGYGESSLLYDRQDQIVVSDYRDLHPESGYVWLVGKPGEHDYYNVPANWSKSYTITSPTSEIRRYKVN